MQTDYLDGEPFLAKLEEAQAKGDTDFVAAHSRWWSAKT